ncbi:MAG: HAD hydrolase family protein [Christensenellaceae bacterium]|nr:HAD hydrolase family protein [Christensenellaceae bacterium]
MTRVFASDFDRTLYFMGEPEEVKPADLAAVEAYQRQGGLFGVCTGRSLKGVTLAIGERVRFDFYILVSGALILDGAMNVIHKRCISRPLLRELCERCCGYEMVIQANDTVYTFDRPHPLQTKITTLDDIEGGDLYGVSIATDSFESARRLTREFNTVYADTLTAHQNYADVDVAPKDCSKGHAIEFIRSHLAADRIGCIGDGHNDMPMIEKADMPFTFSYAPAEVRQRACHVVGSVAEALRIFQSSG